MFASHKWICIFISLQFELYSIDSIVVQQLKPRIPPKPGATVE